MGTWVLWCVKGTCVAVEGFRSRVKGLGFKCWSFGLRVQVLGFGVKGGRRHVRDVGDVLDRHRRIVRHLQGQRERSVLTTFRSEST